MTSTLPPQVQEAFARFITTELTTVDAKGQPIAWPVTPFYEPGNATIDVCTAVGLPKKAEDARRHPQVSLLFSEPKGSGIESGIQVLVHGTAEVDDADLKANRERYEAELPVKIPSSKDMMPPKPVQKLMSWYFERIYVKVRPERVFVWPDGDLGKPPAVHGARIEEVRSGHSEEKAEPPATPVGGNPAWDSRIEELGRHYADAVLAWVAPDGFPLAARLPVRCAGGERLVRIGSEPAGLPAPEGRACVTAHSHGPDFGWQENFQVRGDLTRDGEGLALAPKKLVGGFELPDEGFLAGARRNFRKTIRFYRRRRELLKQRDG